MFVMMRDTSYIPIRIHRRDIAAPTEMASKREGGGITDHKYYGLFCAAAYGVVSITITLFNKAVFNYYEFKFPLTLFVAQMLFSLAFVSPLRPQPARRVSIAASRCASVPDPQTLLVVRVCLIHKHLCRPCVATTCLSRSHHAQVYILKVGFPSLYDFPNPNLAMAKKLWPMALGWWLYGVSGVIALKYLNVPMFSSFRRFTTIIVMFGEYRLYGRVPPADQRNAVLVMTGGAAIAGFTDLTFSLPGYCWVLTCAVSTALYLLFISKLGRESGLNDLGLLFYNNLLALPFMGASLLLSGELPLVAAYKWLHTLDFQVFFLISAMQAFFLNFLIFLCTRVNSPLITSVTGTVKDLVTNALGMTMFGDFPFNPPNVVSIAICFLGSVW